MTFQLDIAWNKIHYLYNTLKHMFILDARWIDIILQSSSRAKHPEKSESISTNSNMQLASQMILHQIRTLDITQKQLVTNPSQQHSLDHLRSM